MSEMPREALRARLTYANVMSTVAVVAMLSTGTAYAAARIGSADVINDSLRSVDIKDSTLTGADIGLDKVGSADVAGLQGGDVADGSLRGDDIEDESINSPDVSGLNSGDITDDSIGGADLAPLTGDDLADQSLDGSELTDSSVGGDEVTNGSLGANDLSGPAKDQLLPPAYVGADGGNVTDTNAGDGRQVMLSKTVPAGRYAVNLTMSADNGGITAGSVNCIVTIGGAAVGASTGVFLGGRNDGTDWYKNVAITGAGTLPAEGEIKLECVAPTAINVQARLVALGVSSIQ
jgi:hypothetical protein